MKSLSKKSNVFALLALSVFGAILSSFSAKPGGEGFEVFLDNKVVLQRFGNQVNSVQNLPLDQSAIASQLTIKYHHCGKAGKNRYVAIKDAQNRILKEWHFADVKDAYASMSCPVKEILALQKGNGNTFNLFYSSSELPNGRVLASIVLPAKNFARP